MLYASTLQDFFETLCHYGKYYRPATVWTLEAHLLQGGSDIVVVILWFISCICFLISIFSIFLYVLMLPHRTPDQPPYLDHPVYEYITIHIIHIHTRQSPIVYFWIRCLQLFRTSTKYLPINKIFAHVHLSRDTFLTILDPLDFKLYFS